MSLYNNSQNTDFFEPKISVLQGPPVLDSGGSNAAAAKDPVLWTTLQHYEKYSPRLVTNRDNLL